MLKVEVSKKIKIILFTLLLIQNIVIRIPSIPHEKGFDSFYIHALANSITTYGQAHWWITWLSAYGLYPESYASALPFLLSGMSQLLGLTGIYMEKSILIYSMLIGIYSVFTAYIFAGLIYKDFLLRYLLALFFSTCQGVLVFSTWEPSARGLFVIVLPLYLFILLSEINFSKKIVLLLICGTFLASTHHYYYFIFPFTAIYFFLVLSSRMSSNKIKYRSRYLKFNYLYIIGLLTTFMIPFFSESMIKAGSRYGWIIDMFKMDTRYIGPLIIFAISGVIYLTFKENKSKEEWYFLIVMLVLTPFNYNDTYGTFIILLYLIVFASISFRNLLDISRKSKICRLSIIILILLSTMFSSYYNHGRTNNMGNNWFMLDSTYSASEWSNKYIPENTYGFGIGESNRLFSASDAHPIMPMGGASDLAYGFTSISEINITKVSPGSASYYLEGPYSAEKVIDIPGKLRWVLENDIDYRGVKPILDTYNFSYFIMPSTDSGIGTQSIRSKKSSVFDDGGISIWIID